MENSDKIIIASTVTIVLCFAIYMHSRKGKASQNKKTGEVVKQSAARPFYKAKPANVGNAMPAYTDEEFFRGGVPGRFKFMRDTQVINVADSQNYKAGDVVEGVYFPPYRNTCPPEAICTMEVMKPGIVRWIDNSRGMQRKFEYPDNNLFQKV